MPKGPKGQKRPASVISNALMVARIATGEIEDTLPSNGKRKAGLAGAEARTNRLTSQQRSGIARKAAKKSGKVEILQSDN